MIHEEVLNSLTKKVDASVFASQISDRVIECPEIAEFIYKRAGLLQKLKHKTQIAENSRALSFAYEAFFCERRFLDLIKPHLSFPLSIKDADWLRRFHISFWGGLYEASMHRGFISWVDWVAGFSEHEWKSDESNLREVLAAACRKILDLEPDDVEADLFNVFQKLNGTADLLINTALEQINSKPAECFARSCSLSEGELERLFPSGYIENLILNFERSSLSDRRSSLKERRNGLNSKAVEKNEAGKSTFNPLIWGLFILAAVLFISMGSNDETGVKEKPQDQPDPQIVENKEIEPEIDASASEPAVESLKLKDEVVELSKFKSMDVLKIYLPSELARGLRNMAPGINAASLKRAEKRFEELLKDPVVLAEIRKLVKKKTTQNHIGFLSMNSKEVVLLTRELSKELLDFRSMKYTSGASLKEFLRAYQNLAMLSSSRNAAASLSKKLLSGSIDHEQEVLEILSRADDPDVVDGFFSALCRLIEERIKMPENMMSRAKVEKNQTSFAEKFNAAVGRLPDQEVQKLLRVQQSPEKAEQGDLLFCTKFLFNTFLSDDVSPSELRAAIFYADDQTGGLK